MGRINKPQAAVHIPAISGDDPKARTRRHYNDQDSTPPEAARRHRRQAQPDAPEWATCCAQPHPDEISMLRDHLAHWQRMHQDLQTTVSRDLQDRVKRDRSIYAAAKQEAWNHAVFNWRRDAARRQIEALNAFSHLGDMIGKLRDEANASPARLRHVVQTLLNTHDAHRQEVERLVRADPHDGVFREVVRLRAAMRAAGELLHAEHGTSTGGRCECPGCEMTRTVALAAQPEPADRGECVGCGVSQDACRLLLASQRERAATHTHCCHMCRMAEGLH